MLLKSLVSTSVSNGQSEEERIATPGSYNHAAGKVKQVLNTNSTTPKKSHPLCLSKETLARPFSWKLLPVLELIPTQ